MESERLTIRIPPELLNQLDQRAESDYPSRVRGQRANRSQVILDALESYLCNDYICTDERIDNLEIAVNELKARLEQLEKKANTPPKRQELTSAELARLLKKNPSTISKWTTNPPEDLKWKFDPTKKLWSEINSD